MAQDQGGSGGGGGGETPEERNARLQAAFDAASKYGTPNVPNEPNFKYGTPDVPNEPTIVDEIYNVQNIQGDTNTGFRATHLDVPYEQWRANISVSRPWEPYTSRLDYDTQSIQGTPRAAIAQTSWTDSQLGMLGGMSPNAAVAWGARYTGQALFGGYSVVDQSFFPGAFDLSSGELINPDLMPSLLSPAFAYSLGISEEQRAMLGYNPEYPYNLQEPSDTGTGGGNGFDSGPSYGYGGGGAGPRGGRGASDPLLTWRIGL